MGAGLKRGSFALWRCAPTARPPCTDRSGYSCTQQRLGGRQCVFVFTTRPPAASFARGCFAGRRRWQRSAASASPARRCSFPRFWCAARSRSPNQPRRRAFAPLLPRRRGSPRQSGSPPRPPLSTRASTPSTRRRARRRRRSATTRSRRCRKAPTPRSRGSCSGFLELPRIRPPAAISTSATSMPMCRPASTASCFRTASAVSAPFSIRR